MKVDFITYTIYFSKLPINIMLKVSLFSALLIILCSYNSIGQTDQKKLKVNEQRIVQRIMELSKFGKDSAGNGFRVAYSKGDVEGRAYIIDLMRKAGLNVSIDFAGNIIGKKDGKDMKLKPIIFGSHTDMVPNGGNYDGCVGVIGALEVIETLNENHITTNHPLTMIVFENEEGGEIGSHAFLGHLNNNVMNQVSKSGLTIHNGIKAIGGNPDSITYAKQQTGAFSAYLELHIEQGGFLEKDKVNIGVVEGIVGIEEWEVSVNGFANHAGTTPMNNRQDALLAASELIIASNEIVRSVPGRQVENVGKIQVEPGAANVIPGKVYFNLEIRDLSANKIQMLFNKIERKAESIAKQSGVTISFKNLHMTSTPALMDKNMQDIIKSAASKLRLSYKVMQSGAGHDAQEMAGLAQSGMIFIPSIGGISHSPKEYSTPGDMTNGINVLLQSILAADKR
ncbi:MAG: Zn-dependent hydrolase [Ginsengibacter sp.]